MENQKPIETWDENVLVFKRNMVTTVLFFILIALILYFSIVMLIQGAYENTINGILLPLLAGAFFWFFWWYWNRQVPVLADDQGIKFGNKPKVKWSDINKYTDIVMKNTFGFLAITTSRYVYVKFKNPLKDGKNSKIKLHKSMISNYNDLIGIIDSHM